MALVYSLPPDSALARAVRQQQPMSLPASNGDGPAKPRRTSTPAEIERFMQRVNER